MDDRGMIRHFATAVAAVLAALLLWAPLPFGSVTRGGAAVVQAACFLAFAAAALTARRRDLRAVAAPAAALAAVALLGALQALPWPEPLVARISPRHAELWQAADAVPLSLAPDASRRAALTWAALAAALVAAAVAGRRRDRRRWLLAAVVAAALFQALYGARRWLSGAAAIWGVDVPGDPSRLRGTFVNPDHLASYLEIALAVVFAWGWWGVRQARREPSAERRLLRVAPPVLAWLTLFLGLAFTGSRGGLAAAVVAVSAQGLLLARGARRRRLAPVGAVAALAGLGVVAVVGLQQGLGRLAATSAYEVTWNARRQVYAATWELWQAFPWLGTGLGTFRDALALTQPGDLRGTWWHAHSDWLELPATTGVLGAALFLLGLVPLVLRLSRGWTADRRSEDRAAPLAALGALVSLAVHEAIDFGLTMPATALTLAVLAGAAAAASAVEEGSPATAVTGRRVREAAAPYPERAAGRPTRPRSPRGGDRRPARA